MFDTLKLVFDTFGKDLMVPVMIFIICMIFKAPAKKAFSSAVLVGVGLKGMTFIPLSLVLYFHHWFSS